MRELRQSIVNLPFSLDAEKVVEEIEKEVRKYWNEGWVFVKAEPDGILESVCIYFEREVYVE